MNFDEIVEIIGSLADIDVTKLSAKEQAIFILACEEFANKIKPLVIKLKLSAEKPTSFLFRMDQGGRK